MAEPGGILDAVSTRVTSPVLVGRADQLAALDAALGRVMGGATSAVLIGGEAGVGKSRLVSEFAAGTGGGRAHTGAGAGVTVLTGGCLELGTDGLPFAPFTTVLRELVRDIGADGVAELLPGRATRELARLLPEFGQPGSDGDAGEARGRLFEQMLSLLGRLADRGPVVLVVEDLHWADRSTRDLLAFLIRNQRDIGSLLIVVTYRSDELHRTHPLRPFLAELDRVAWVERIELPRLSRRNAGELVASLLGREPELSLADTVYQRTDGNPLFIEALLCCDGKLSCELPESLRDLLLDSVRRLPEETQEILRVASAGGRRIGHGLLAAVTGLDDGTLTRALRPAVAGNVLLTDSDGYLFRHTLIREAVHDDLLPGEHGRLHTRFAEALGAQPALVPAGRAVIEQAHHWYSAHDMRWALICAWHAATEAGRALAYAEQLTMLTRVLELWDKVPDAAESIGADHLRVLEEVVAVSHTAGENERGLAYADAAVKEADATAEPTRAALLLADRGKLKYQLGHPDGIQDLNEALRLLPGDASGVARMRVLSVLAMNLSLTPDRAAGRAAAEEAIALARAAGDELNEIQAVVTLALIESDCGDGQPEQHLEMLAQARERAERAGAYQQLLRVITNESHMLEGMGKHERAAEVARRGIASATEYGRARTVGTFLAINLAEPLVSLGCWDEAAEVIDRALDLSPPPLVRLQLRCLSANVALARGDLAAAAEATAAAGTLIANTRYKAQEDLPFTRLVIDLRLAEGWVADALSAAEDALDRFDLQHGSRYVWPLLVAGARACAEAVHASAASRDAALAVRAAALAGRLRAQAGKLGADGPVQQANLLTFTAEAARADGADDVAAWDTAAAAWDKLGQPYPLATALLRGAAAAVSTDRDSAEIRLLRASQLAGRLGAQPLRDEIGLLARRARIAPVPGGAHAGAAAGKIPARAPAADDADGSRQRLGLTAREFEVLGLVASGRSNREIADQLFISVKTASVHVSNILAKLSASSRGEAAATAHRLRLFDPAPSS